MSRVLYPVGNELAYKKAFINDEIFDMHLLLFG